MAHNDKTWNYVTQPLIADGGTDGTVQLASTAGFFTNQKVFISGGNLSTTELKVLNVMDGSFLRLGIPDTSRINSGIDLSNYTLTIGSRLAAPEQPKDKSDASNVLFYSFQADPVSALRTYPATTPACLQYMRIPANSIVTANNTITATVAIMTVTSDVKIAKIFNSLNQDVSITYNGLEKFRLETGDSLSLDLASNGSTWPTGTKLAIYYNGVLPPSTGSIRFILTS